MVKLLVQAKPVKLYRMEMDGGDGVGMVKQPHTSLHKSDSGLTSGWSGGLKIPRSVSILFAAAHLGRYLANAV